MKGYMFEEFILLSSTLCWKGQGVCFSGSWKQAVILFQAQKGMVVKFLRLTKYLEGSDAVGAGSQWESAGNQQAGCKELALFSNDFLPCEKYWCSGIFSEGRILESQNA